MIAEQLTKALVSKAKSQCKDEDPRIISTRAKLVAAKQASDEDAVAFYSTFLHTLLNKKPYKKKTVASPAYRISKMRGYSTKQASRIGLAFLAYARNTISMVELSTLTKMDENEIFNYYGDCLSE